MVAVQPIYCSTSNRGMQPSGRDEQDRGSTRKQPAVLQTFTNCTRYDKNGARWKAITDAVAMYIAKDMVPIYIVEKPGFIHMLKVLGCRYVLPSRQYFSEVALPALYNSTRQRIVRELEGVLFYSKRVTSFYVLCYVKLYVTLHYIATLCYATFSLFKMAGPAILSFWLVVFDCTLTPRGKSRSNQNKIKFKLVLNKFFVICR